MKAESPGLGNQAAKLWMADLLRHGLVRGSFIPGRAQRELRELTRYRRGPLTRIGIIF